jgi:hypothetical protein
MPSPFASLKETKLTLHWADLLESLGLSCSSRSWKEILFFCLPNKIVERDLSMIRESIILWPVKNDLASLDFEVSNVEKPYGVYALDQQSDIF